MCCNSNFLNGVNRSGGRNRSSCCGFGNCNSCGNSRNSDNVYVCNVNGDFAVIDGVLYSISAYDADRRSSCCNCNCNCNCNCGCNRLG